MELIDGILDKQRKNRASMRKYVETGLILVLPSSCGLEPGAPLPPVSAAALGVGLQRRENVRGLFNFFSSPSLPVTSLALKTETKAF